MIRPPTAPNPSYFFNRFLQPQYWNKNKHSKSILVDRVSSRRVPYTFFVTREWAFLLCVKREWGFIFSVIRGSTFFRPRETSFRFFRDPWNMHFLSRDCEPTTFAGITFHFCRDFSVIKARKLHQTRCKTYRYIVREPRSTREIGNYNFKCMFGCLDAKPAHSMRLRNGKLIEN